MWRARDTWIRLNRLIGMDRTKKRSNLQVADRNCIETETGNRESRFGLLPNARTTEWTCEVHR